MGSAAGARYEVEAVVFDMDGVLIDSRPVIERAWSEVARRHGRALTAADAERYVHGRTGAETVRMLFPGRTDQERKAIWAEVDAVEEDSPYPAVPGADTMALALAGAGAALALVTSSWPRKIDNALGRLGLLHLFAERVTRDDVANGKPHPDPYLVATRRLGTDPARTLVFEDSVSGVASAVAAGTVCVGIGGRELRAAGAVAVTGDFTPLSAEAGPDGILLTGLDAPVRILPREAGRRA
jgi:sugar-phosphatase